MTKIILFILIILSFLLITQREALAQVTCSYTFEPSELRVGDNGLFRTNKLTITPNSPDDFNAPTQGYQYYALLLDKDGAGPCLEDPTNFNNSGCKTDDIQAGPNGIFEAQGDRQLKTLFELEAEDYEIRLCDSYDRNSCFGAPKCNPVNIKIETKDGNPPPDDGPGDPAGSDCRITNEENINACIQRGVRFQTNCKPTLYCETNLGGGADGQCRTTGKCKPCPDPAESCYNDSEEPAPTNTPLSLPCQKNDSSYSEGEGCLKIRTSLGNVRTDAAGFTRWVLGFVLSIAGGIVIIIIIVAGYKLMTSQGDPEKVKNARDQLTAAIVGLLFIIFSLALLELITRDILGLPGFGG